jgi:hypothetical protein
VIFNGSFGGPVPTLTLTNTIISGNQWYACEHWTGANILISGGNNLIQDDTCNPVVSDKIGVNPLCSALWPTMAAPPGCMPCWQAAPPHTSAESHVRKVRVATSVPMKHHRFTGK